MGSRTLAALMVQSPRFKGPMDFQREAASLQNLMQVNKLRGAQTNRLNLANQGEQRRQQAKQRATAQEQKDQSLFLELFIREKDEDKAIDLFLDAGGSMSFYSKAKESRLKAKKDRAALRGDRLKNFTTRNKIRGQVAEYLLSLPPEQRAQEWPRAYQHLIRSGAASAEQLSEEYPGDKFLEFHAAVSLSTEKQIELDQQEQQDSINDPGRAADADLKVYKQIARNMSRATNQRQWSVYRNHLKARFKKVGTSLDYLDDLIPEEYSPEAVQQVKELAIAPRAPGGGRQLSGAGKALAERTKQRAIQKAQDSYREKITKLKEWKPSKYGTGLFENEKGEEITLSEYRLRKKQAEDELNDDVDLAEDSYNAQLEALGFDPNVQRPGQRETNPAGAGEGMTAVNPKTGERLVLKEGKWVRVQ